MLLNATLFLLGIAALFVPYHYKSAGTPQRLANALAEIPKALKDIAALRHPFMACVVLLFILIGAFAPLIPAIISFVLGAEPSTPPDPHRAAFAISTLILLVATVVCFLLMEVSQMVFGFGASRSGQRTPWMALILLLPALSTLASALAIFHRGWALAILRACA